LFAGIYYNIDLKIKIIFLRNYIAKQQKTLANRFFFSHNAFALGIFTGVGAYPPKPPPLVEPQRNPTGLRFFLSERSGWRACVASQNNVIQRRVAAMPAIVGVAGSSSALRTRGAGFVG
jgi:hypothetical protein